jgi:hypothetical protein
LYPGQAALAAKKSKLLKGNERKKAFISFYLFFGNGPFQWVTTDSNKKIFFLGWVRTASQLSLEI